jgi:hypothetical protein
VKASLVLRACAVVLGIVLLGAACSSTKHTAATVNGQVITDQDVVDELNAIAGNTDYVNLLAAGRPSGSIRGESPGSFDAGFVAQVLQGRIGYALVHQELARRKVTIDDACRNAATQDAYSQIGNQDVNKGKQIVDQFPKSFRDTLLQRNAEVLALSAALVDLPCQPADAARAYFDAHPNEFAQACLSIMQLDPAKADAVYAQLQGGADFNTVAQTSATDGKVQDLGCISLHQFPTALADTLAKTPVGGVAGPVPNGTSTVIIKVNDRKGASFDEVRSQADELVTVAHENSIGSWYQDALGTSKVTVDARYGTWDQANGSIQPPGATSTTSPPSGESSTSSSSVTTSTLPGEPAP